MKTIEVSDAMYDNLVQLATEMDTQNKRGTRMPHIFQIRDWERVWDDNLNGDVELYIDTTDGDVVEIQSLSELREYMRLEDVEDNENLDELWDETYPYDLDDWIDDNLPKLKKTSYSLKPVYKNAFLTAKAAEEHLSCNHYHYHEEADVYLNHAWRNPEAELVSEFLLGLIGKTLHT
jgi:hypothetical protein